LIFDGSKTANVFLDDIRVGDVVEYAYTLQGSNPVFKQLQFGAFDLQVGVPVKKRNARLLVPNDRELVFNLINTQEKAKQRDLPGEKEYLWESTDVPAMVVSDSAPTWYDPYPFVQWTEFKDWSAVVQWLCRIIRHPKSYRRSYKRKSLKLRGKTRHLNKKSWQCCNLCKQKFAI